MKKLLVILPAIALAVALVRLLLSRGNTQVHRINQDKPSKV
ncbi:hypothetical protein [Nonomuraea sp. MG754425]|nr:hypothetical protein [Nonomuraea sp. MG754425]